MLLTTYILSMDMERAGSNLAVGLVDIHVNYNIIIPLFNCNTLIFSNLRLLRGVQERTAILEVSIKSVNYFRRSPHLKKVDAMPVSSGN